MDLMLTGMMHCSNCGLWTGLLSIIGPKLPTVMLPSAAQRRRQDNICGAVFITVRDH